MWQSNVGRGQSPIVKVVVAGVSTAALAALAATALLPSVDLTPTLAAAIEDSGSTIGFSDPYLYGATDAQIDQQLDQMQALGVNDVRILIPWAGVEPVQGYYDWSSVDYTVNAANARGMGVLGVLNSSPSWAVNPGVPAISGAPASPTQYGDFAGLVAQRYAGKVSAYEIWNEPNGQTYYAPKPDPAGYTQLLKAAYPEIKAADPNATVIGGVTGAVIDYGDFTMNPVTFVKGIYAAGGQGYFDALSYHPYNYGTPFSQGAPLPDSPLNQLTAMRDLMIANGDASKQIWASEYGEPTAVATDDQQAAFIQDMLTTWPTLGYTGPTFIDTLNDVNTNSTNPEDTLGVIASDGTLKPAAYVIAQLEAQRAAAAATATNPAAAMNAMMAAMGKQMEATMGAMGTQMQTAAGAMGTQMEAAAGAMGTQMEAAAGAMGTQMEAAAGAMGKALQTSAATMMGAQPASTSAASKTATPEMTKVAAQPDTSPAAVPAKQANLKSVTPAASTASTASTVGNAPTSTTSAATLATDTSKTADTAKVGTKQSDSSKTTPKQDATPKHRKADSGNSPTGATPAATGSRHAKDNGAS